MSASCGPLFSRLAAVFLAGATVVLLLTPMLQSRQAEGVPDEELFGQLCSGCHGPRGEGGSGPGLLLGRQVQQMRRLSEQELFRLIRKGVPGTEMPPFPLPEQQLQQLARFVRSLNAPAIESAAAGNADDGRAVFFGKGSCTNCHMLRGQGGFLGPDLSNIGQGRTLSQLQQALVDPDAEVPNGFQGVTVTTTDGRQIAGIAKNNDNYSIQILDARGGLHLLRRGDLQSVVLHEKSLMPGYAGRLSEKEIDDLTAFLSQQSIRPPSAQ